MKKVSKKKKAKKEKREKRIEQAEDAAKGKKTTPASISSQDSDSVTKMKSYKNPDGKIVTIMPGAKQVPNPTTTTEAPQSGNKIDDLVKAFSADIKKSADTIKKQFDVGSSSNPSKSTDKADDTKPKSPEKPS